VAKRGKKDGGSLFDESDGGGTIVTGSGGSAGPTDPENVQLHEAAQTR
jgi:hypothetical protein